MQLSPTPCLCLAQEAAFPRVQRDILQVEQYSQKLRGRAVRADAGADALEASRLLAGEGVNPRRLGAALQALELRPTYEDVFAVETASVEEYLQQVRVCMCMCVCVCIRVERAGVVVVKRGEGEGREG